MEKWWDSGLKWSGQVSWPSGGSVEDRMLYDIAFVFLCVYMYVRVYAFTRVGFVAMPFKEGQEQLV